jgi:predicted RNA-binding Zn ribbon-like protein
MKERAISDIVIVGGRACFDFTNTTSGRGGRQLEHMTRAARLVDWARHAGVIDAAEHRRIRACLASAPLFTQDALALREGLYRLFSAIAAQRAPDPADVALLNRWVERSYGHVAVVPEPGPAKPGGFALGWRSEPATPETILYRMVRSAVDVLTRDPPERIKQCTGRDCGFLFFDATRNNSRRWCEMALCGNRAKAQRAYRRRARTPAG